MAGSDRDEPVRCACCGYRTIGNRGQYEICPVCFWEDEGMTGAELGAYSWPNHMTLGQGQEAFRTLGACGARFVRLVRAPKPEEQQLRLDETGKWVHAALAKRGGVLTSLPFPSPDAPEHFVSHQGDAGLRGAGRGLCAASGASRPREGGATQGRRFGDGASGDHLWAGSG